MVESLESPKKAATLALQKRLGHLRSLALKELAQTSGIALRVHLITNIPR